MTQKFYAFHPRRRLHFKTPDASKEYLTFNRTIVLVLMHFFLSVESKPFKKKSSKHRILRLRTDNGKESSSSSGSSLVGGSNNAIPRAMVASTPLDTNGSRDRFFAEPGLSSIKSESV